MKRQTCNRCHKTKLIAFFYKNKSKKNGLSDWCIACNKKYKKAYNIRLFKRNSQYIKYPRTKKCCKCNKIKTAKNFYRSLSKKDGLSFVCKKCSMAYSLEIKRKNIKKPVIVKKKRCTKCNKIKSAKYFFRDMHSSKGLTSWCKQCKIIYYKKLMRRKLMAIMTPLKKKCCACKQNKAANNFYRCNSFKSGLRSICKKCTKKWNYDHKKERNQYVRNRASIDPEFRILRSLRSNLKNALARQSATKTSSTTDVIGCTLGFLKRYFESQFCKNMSWHNYGRGFKQWSIDHIIPCAYFNLLNGKEQRKCFNWKNLRPLWNYIQWKKNSFYNGKMLRKRVS